MNLKIYSQPNNLIKNIIPTVHGLTLLIAVLMIVCFSRTGTIAPSSCIIIFVYKHHYSNLCEIRKPA